MSFTLELFNKKEILVYRNYYRYVSKRVKKFLVVAHINNEIRDINLFVNIVPLIIHFKIKKYDSYFKRRLLKHLLSKILCLKKFSNNLVIYNSFRYIPPQVGCRDALKIKRAEVGGHWFVKSLDAWILSVMNVDKEEFFSCMVDRLKQLSREVGLFPLPNNDKGYYLSIVGTIFTPEENNVLLKVPVLRAYIVNSLQCLAFDNKHISYNLSDSANIELNLTSLSLNLMLGDEDIDNDNVDDISNQLQSLDIQFESDDD